MSDLESMTGPYLTGVTCKMQTVNRAETGAWFKQCAGATQAYAAICLRHYQLAAKALPRHIWASLRSKQDRALRATTPHLLNNQPAALATPAPARSIAHTQAANDARGEQLHTRATAAATRAIHKQGAWWAAAGIYSRGWHAAHLALLASYKRAQHIVYPSTPPPPGCRHDVLLPQRR